MEKKTKKTLVFRLFQTYSLFLVPMVILLCTIVHQNVTLLCNYAFVPIKLVLFLLHFPLPSNHHSTVNLFKMNLSEILHTSRVKGYFSSSTLDFL